MEEFVDDTLALLQLEREAELSESEVFLSKQLHNAREMEARGICLQRLQVVSQRVGLYGREIVTFELASRGKGAKQQLPSHSITSGDIVGVFAGGSSLCERPLSGVVTRSSETAVSVAYDNLPDSLLLSSYNGSLQIVRLANDITYQRNKRSLEELESYHAGPAHHLIEVLFGETPPGPLNPKYSQWMDSQNVQATCDFPFFNTALDPSQRRAVLFSLSRPDVAIIHGPPGTGKTTTVVEVILQAVRMGQKVLACAPSNIAVDNIVERLGTARAKVIRIGHPARLVDSVLRYSLDALLAASDSAQIVQDVRKDIEKALVQRYKARDSTERRRWRGEVKALRKELQQREKKALRELLSSADVILATATGASLDGPIKYLPENHFDVVVIDECAQALEASCWIPLLRASKCVLAGDHMQLPPTIISQEAAEKGLSVTLMERLVTLYGSQVTSMLTEQYRMHQKIMSWPSTSLYGNQLVAHESVVEHLLQDLPSITSTKETSIPLLFIDTAGCDLSELDTTDEESRGNEGEANLVIHHLKALLDAGVAPSDIAVIAPYNLQVELIRQRLPSLPAACSQLEVRSVDGFQGREKEAVIISFTRSNKKGEFGFLRERRRTNVAVTRARRHLALIGDSETISHEPFIKGLIEYCYKHGEVWSAHEYIHDVSFEETHLYQPKPRPQQKCSRKNDAESQDLAESDVNTKKSSKGKRMGSISGESSTLAAQLSCHKESDPGKDEDTKTKFLEQLQEFKSQEQEIVFSYPPSLSGNERKVIHELCEQLGLSHVSKGQGQERFIQVEKKTVTDISVPSAVDGTKEEPTPSVCGLETNEEKDQSKCGVCGKSIPIAAIELHQIHCEKLKKYPESPAALHSKGASRSTKAKKGTDGTSTSAKQKSRKKFATKADTDDLDAMLADMTLADSTCGFPKCKKSINILGIRCQFCSQQFCMAHSIAEVHGCAEAAKKHARQQISKELRGSSKLKSLDPTKRAQLQRKLDKKIEDMSSGRQTKSRK